LLRSLPVALSVTDATSGFQGWLWTDALCINQHDLDERGLQVARMVDIYSDAARVMVWLQPSPEADRAMARISIGSSFSDLFRPARKAKGNAHQNLAELALWNVQLCRLANLEYWSRTWIIQEIVLAKELVVICGGREMSWKHLIGCIEAVRENDHLLDSQALMMITPIRADGAHFELPHERNQPVWQHHFQAQLAEITRFEFMRTDPKERDR
jgi:hypothetical protein